MLVQQITADNSQNKSAPLKPVWGKPAVNLVATREKIKDGGVKQKN